MVSRACLVLLLVAGVADASPARHVRIATTDRGPIHVWVPAHYDPSTAGVVVYVHGLYTTVDRAWRHHRLARQFAASRVNALFIACEAPRSPGKPVVWTSLGELLEQTAHGFGAPLPEGPVIAVGHSGAYRTVASWLDDERLATVVLLDGLYGEVDRYRTWIEGSPDRRFINVAELAQRWADPLHAELPETVRFESFPAELPDDEAARIIYIRSQLGHMSLVTGGVALPRILVSLRIARLPARSRGPRGRRAP